MSCPGEPDFPQRRRSLPSAPGERHLRHPRIAIACFLTAAIGVFALLVRGGVTPVAKGELADPDCYMRLVRVSELHATGAWYDDALPRSNAPYGESSHWTRPLDLLLLGPASLAAIATDFPTALYWTGVWISPLLLLCACLALVWAARPLWSNERRFWLMPALFVQFALFVYSVPGRADHHTLIALLSILVLGFGLRATLRPFDRRLAVVAGLTGAAAIWVSPEGIFFLALVYLFLAIGWVWAGSNEEPRKAMWLSLALAAGLAVAMLVERPPGKFLVVEHDKVSFVHFAAALLAMGAWWAARVGARTGGWPARLAVLAGLALIAFIVLGAIAPGFHRGVLGAFDPRLERLWVPRIGELRPQIPTNPGTLATFLQFLGTPALMIPFAMSRAWRARRERDLHVQLGLALATVAFFVMGLFHIRLSIFASLLAPLYMVDLTVRVHARLQVIRLGALRAAACLAFRAVVSVGPLVAGLALASSLGGGGSARRPISDACPLREISAWLEARRETGSSPIILAQADAFGPELLYRSGYRVVAGPYHRGYRGILDLYDVWNAPADQDARRIIDRRGVDLLLVCRADDRTILYPDRSTADTFFGRIREGRLPSWLSPVPLPPRLESAFALYEVHRH